MFTVFRVADLDKGYGPFMYQNGELYRKTRMFETYSPSCADKFPVWVYDLPKVRSLHDSVGIRIGVEHPCLIFYWFGENLDILKGKFGIYSFKVKNYIKSESGLQCAFYTKDVVEQKLLTKI